MPNKLNLCLLVHCFEFITRYDSNKNFSLFPQSSRISGNVYENLGPRAMRASREKLPGGSYMTWGLPKTVLYGGRCSFKSQK